MGKQVNLKLSFFGSHSTYGSYFFRWFTLYSNTNCVFLPPVWVDEGSTVNTATFFFIVVVKYFPNVSMRELLPIINFVSQTPKYNKILNSRFKLLPAPGGPVIPFTQD